LDRFERVNTQVLGISVDSKDCLHAWAESFDGITYPLLSDFWPHGQVAQKYGVLRSEGYSERAIFIIDRTGIIRYVDVHNIDEQPDNEVLFRELAEIEGVPVPQEFIPETAGAAVQSVPAMAGPAPAPVPPPEQVRVVIYCTDWCPACRRARAYLKVNNIPFEEVNITRDRAAAARVRAMTGGHESTPTFEVGGSVVVNFDVDKLNKLLGIEG
jgi:glutaredoxin